MKLSIHPYFLEFIRPFALAHGTRSGTQLAYIRIEHQGITAYGEASLPPYLPETFESVKSWIENQSQFLTDLLNSNPFEHPERIPFSIENPAASAALQSALLNWKARYDDRQLGSYFKNGNTIPGLTLTITKNDFVILPEKLALAKHFTHLKLKLTGASDDIDFVKAIRKKTDVPFCIDVNQGFRKKEDAIKLISSLENQYCILVEQPLSAQDHDGHYWLKQRVPTPIIADESIRLYDDLVQFHEAYSGVNIKLMKCGGLFQAQKMIDFQSNDTDFMKLLGCMTESTLGVATSAVLAPQFAMTDLDAPYLIKNDPFRGFGIVNGKIQIDAISRTGVEF